MNSNFVKTVISNGGSIQPITIPSDYTAGTGLTNPSIFIKDGNVHVNLRHVQYTLWHNENQQKFPNQWGPLAYLNPEDDITLRTTNFECELDPNTLTVTANQKVDTSKLDVKPIWEFIGLEDARIVEWNHKTYLCGVRRDTKTDGEGRMELSEIVDGQEIARYRIEPPTPTYCEKNWMPITDMPFHFVKWSNPTEVVKVDLETLTSETVSLTEQTITFPRDIRGGSQVIPYGDYRIALTHEVDLWHNEQGQKDAQYYHRFIVWDKDWNIVTASDEFKFLAANIEFSCGIAIHEGNILIPFGFQDTTAYLLTIPCTWFNSEILKSNDVVTHKTFNTPKLIQEFVENTTDQHANFNLAEYYFQRGHTASALSFYLRTAEYGDNISLIYSALNKVGKCLGQQGRRSASELTAYLNAIRFQPTRPEAYLYLSYYYEFRKEWIHAYTYACLALEHSKRNSYFEPDYVYIFQKAVTAWWAGHAAESRELFFMLANNYADVMTEQYKNLVQTNITSLGSGPDPFLPYTALDYPELKHKFPGAETIKGNYAQTYQDMFILTMLDGKRNGTYLEIGAADPFKGSNTALLEQWGWQGASIEILEHEVEKFKQHRSNPIYLQDATQIDYDSFIENLELGNTFDYLQVDCEPPSTTFDILKMIPLEKYKFAVITFEHDYYADITKLYRDESRAYLESKGYELVVSNISPNDNCPYEDWWVHPDLVDRKIIDRVKDNSNTIKHAKKFMLK